MRLIDIQHELHSKAKKHKDYEKTLQIIYYLLGGTSTLLLMVSTIFQGSSEMGVGFIITLLSTIFNSAIAFFSINQKTSLSHSFASDCKDLELNIKIFLQSVHGQESEIVFKKMILNQQKRHYDREPGISPCFG